MTTSNGVSSMKLPLGNYSVAVHFNDVYWLTPIFVMEERTVSVENNVVVKIALADYPPPIWGTTGFLVIIAMIAALALITFLIMSKRKRKLGQSS